MARPAPRLRTVPATGALPAGQRRIARAWRGRLRRLTPGAAAGAAPGAEIVAVDRTLDKLERGLPAVRRIEADIAQPGLLDELIRPRGSGGVADGALQPGPLQHAAARRDRRELQRSAAGREVVRGARALARALFDLRGVRTDGARPARSRHAQDGRGRDRALPRTGAARALDLRGRQAAARARDLGARPARRSSASRSSVRSTSSARAWTSSPASTARASRACSPASCTRS